MAEDSCALADGFTSLHRPMAFPAAEDKLVQLTWRTGSAPGGMIVSVASGSAVVISAGCSSVSSQTCQFQLATPLGSSSLSLPLMALQVYVISVFVRGTTVEAQLFLNNTASGSMQSLGLVNQTAGVFDWSNATYSFANLAGNFSCAHRLQVFSVCRANEQPVNGTCYGKLCVGGPGGKGGRARLFVDDRRVLIISRCLSRLRRGPQALLWCVFLFFVHVAHIRTA
jgi:hypothetical protein